MGKKNKKKKYYEENSEARKTSNDIVVLLEKNAGNEEYQKSNFEQAIKHYTTGIALSARNPSLLLLNLINRATSFLRLKEFHYAVEDSSSALQLEENVRAHICRGFGYFFMQQYGKAFEDYEVASKLQPNNIDLQNALQLAKDALTLQLKKIKDLASAAKPGKKLRDTALQWVGDFGLLGIDEDPLPLSLQPKNPTDGNSLEYKRVTTSTLLPNGKKFSTSHQLGADTTFKPHQSDGKTSAQEEPPLIAVGDWIYGMENEAEKILRYTADQRHKMAMEEKVAGNTAFTAQQYLNAVGHYSKAIWLDCCNGIYYSNRGIAYIKLGRWAEAITDCSMSLVYGPSVKAYLRRGTAWAAVGSYWLAVQDYKDALDYEPANPDCIKGIECALTILDEQTRMLAGNSEQFHLASHKIKEEFKAVASMRAAAEQLKAEATKPPPIKPPPPFNHKSNTITPPLCSHGTTPVQTTAHTKPAPASKAQQSDFAKLQEMLSKFSTMIAADELNSGARMGRADIYIQLGDVDKAIADYQRGLKLDPDNPELFKRWQFAVKKRKGS